MSSASIHKRLRAAESALSNARSASEQAEAVRVERALKQLSVEELEELLALSQRARAVDGSTDLSLLSEVDFARYAEISADAENRANSKEANKGFTT